MFRKLAKVVKEWFAAEKWEQGVIGYAAPHGGLLLIGGAPEPYVRTQLADKCIVYTGCTVWRHRDTRQITTRKPEELD